MLVYGDRQERADPARLAREINASLEAAGHMSPGLERHSKLVGALIEAGRLLQGIADARFSKANGDGRSSATDKLTDFLLEIAQAVACSFDSDFAQVGNLPRLFPDPDWPDEIQIRVPEGFAFYALYPEAYLEAARRLKLSAPPRVIGIRSIGTSLSAMVAAALGAPAPVTVRPFGDPFARKIAIEASLERELLDGEAHYVIVDEGPGQSGSSFGAVGDWLEERGVPTSRIALLPSHGGAPGPAAGEERLRWWTRTQREVSDFKESWPMIIERWCSTSLGPLDKPLADLSAGQWRKVFYASEDDWPAAFPGFERRKYLAEANGARFLVKFAGLGRIGEEKLSIARALHSEGLAQEPVALLHGFLVERWCEGGVPLGCEDKPIREIGRYIGARARLFPASGQSGASIEELGLMVRRNIGLELGEELASLVEHVLGDPNELQRKVLPVRTDNKLDLHEWLRTPSGTVLKTDALDHHQAHDLVGCQDVAWDVAGAIVEFDLDQSQSRKLAAFVEECAHRRIDPDLLSFYRIAYLAFRLGLARLSQSMISGERERARIKLRGDGYAAELQHLLECSSRATRLESLVG